MTLKIPVQPFPNTNWPRNITILTSRSMVAFWIWLNAVRYLATLLAMWWGGFSMVLSITASSTKSVNLLGRKLLKRPTRRICPVHSPPLRGMSSRHPLRSERHCIATSFFVAPDAYRHCPLHASIVLTPRAFGTGWTRCVNRA